MPSRMPNSLLPSTVTTSKSIESICIVFLHPKLTCDVHTTGTHENARNLGHLQRIQAQHGRGRFLLVIGMKMQCRAQTCLAIIQLSFLAQACVANLRSTVILWPRLLQFSVEAWMIDVACWHWIRALQPQVPQSALVWSYAQHNQCNVFTEIWRVFCRWHPAC